MRRGMLIALALVIVMIGAGIFVLTTTVLAPPAQANPALPATNAAALTTGKPAISEPGQALPVSSVPYGADAEGALTTTAPKAQEHSCESGY